MRGLFALVYRTLKEIALRLDLTYEEVNILVYYALLPLVFSLLLDEVLGGHVLTVVAVFLVALLVVPRSRFRARSERLFERSVHFLESFDVIGLDYVAASVVVCVILPLLVLGFLVILAV